MWAGTSTGHEQLVKYHFAKNYFKQEEVFDRRSDQKLTLSVYIDEYLKQKKVYTTDYQIDT